MEESESVDIDVLKKRLKKALQVAEKLKKDSLLEHEVNKELARRNEALKKDQSTFIGRLSYGKSLLANVDNNVQLLVKLTEELAKIRPTSTENEISLLQDISSTQLNCLESCRLLKETLLTEQEISEEKTTGGKGISYDMDSKAGVDSAVELCESSSYLQTGSVAAEEATDESEDDFGRSRTESTASRGRTQSISGVRARRNSSIFIRLPDNMGTSLIRKSADVFPNSQALNTTASADLHEQETDSPDTIAAPVEYHKASVVSFLDESVDYCQQELEDLDISKMAAGNESMYVEPVDTTKVALFEHFIVVGASEEVAIEFAHQLQCSYDEGTLSTMFKNTFGGFFSTNRFGAGATTTSSTTGISSTNNTASTSALVRQKSEDKGAKVGNTGANKRRSFGLGSTTTTAGAAAPTTTAAAAETTPVRTAGMFSYFLRSPTAGATDPGADKSKNSTATHSTSNKPSNELGSNVEFNSFVDTVKVEPGDITPGKPRPVRKFIYGDDSSETGSSHGSADLTTAAANGEPSPTSSGPLRASPSRKISTPTTPAEHSASGGSLIDFDDADHDSAAADATAQATHRSGDGSPTDLLGLETSTDAAVADIGGDSELGAGARLSEGEVEVPLLTSSMGESASADDTIVPASASSGTLSRFGGAMMSSLYGMSSAKSATGSVAGSSSDNLTVSTTAAPSAATAIAVSEKKEKETETSSSRVESTDSNDTIGGYFFGNSFSPAKIAARKAQEAAAAEAADRAANKPEDVFVRGRTRSAHGGSDLTSPPGARAGVAAGAGRGGAGVETVAVVGAAVPVMAYSSNPSAAELIMSSDKKLGTATTKAEILYRYPHSVEPPPQEVSDFCMPLGGKISKLSDFDSGTTVQEILFGHSHSKRSSRCFIFLLEDKTLADEMGDEETGMGTNRLYGICVLHPRLVKTPIQNTRRKNPLAGSNSTHTSVIDASVHGSYNGTAGMVAESEFIEFESMVCYAFLTRFPLFDFFFQVIFDLINTERLTRMELAAEHTDSDLLYSRSIYEYLPANVLEEVLARLTKMQPPLHGEKFQFHISPGIKPIESVRVPPPADFSEHYMNSSEWALPTLLSWMPIESIIWAMSLLLGEAKIVVLGHDYGMVSCAVIGLLVLLRPLDWVSPVIPMLPIKLMDFVESPVPILVGITVNSKDNTISVETIFNRCSDPSNDGLVLSVLDVSKRELFMSIEDKALIPNLCMPGADKLAARIKECLQEKTIGGTVTLGSGHVHSSRPAKPVYTASVQQKAKTRAAHDVMTKHIAHVAELAVAHQQKLVERRRLVVEMANKMSSPHRVDRQDSTTSFDSQGQDQGQGLGRFDRATSFGLSDVEDSEEDVEDDLPVAATRKGGGGDTGRFGRSSPPTALPSALALTTQSSIAAAAPTAATAVAATAAPQARRNILPANLNMNMGMGQAVTALAPPPPPTPKVIHMSKQPLAGNNTDEFLNRFILTQIFSEHVYRSAAATACTATVETSSKATSSSVFTPTAHAETHINNINNSIPLAMASPIPSVSQNDAPLAPSTACEMKEVKEMKEMKETKESSPVGASSPESPVHPSTKGTSPLSPDEPLAGGVLHTGIDKGDSMLEWDMGLSPRNSMVMRRRSVDMGYLMSSGKLSADHHPSRDAEEDHTHTHAHEHEHIHTMLPAITPEVDEESDGEDIVNSIEQSLEVFST